MELPPEEQPLKKISDFVYRDEEKGRNLWEYMFNTDKHGKGIDFDEIDTAIIKR